MLQCLKSSNPQLRMHTPHPETRLVTLFLLKIAPKSPLGFGGFVEKQYLCSVERINPTTKRSNTPSPDEL